MYLTCKSRSPASPPFLPGIPFPFRRIILPSGMPARNIYLQRLHLSIRILHLNPLFSTKCRIIKADLYFTLNVRTLFGKIPVKMRFTETAVSETAGCSSVKCSGTAKEIFQNIFDIFPAFKMYSLFSVPLNPPAVSSKAASPYRSYNSFFSPRQGRHRLIYFFKFFLQHRHFLHCCPDDTSLPASGMLFLLPGHPRSC